MKQSSWILLGFATALTTFVASMVLIFMRYLQKNWSHQAEVFIKQDKRDVKRVILESSSQLKRLSEVLRNYEEKVDELEYRLLILQDLTEVAAMFSQQAPIPEESFRRLISNVILAATQSLLPTQDNTRARLMIFENGHLVEYAAYTPTSAKPFSGSTFLPGQGAVGTCYLKGEAVLVADAWNDPLFQDRHKPRYRSVLCVPMPASTDHPIGVLNVDASDTNHFQEDHAKMLAAIANIIYPMWRSQFFGVGPQPINGYNEDEGRRDNG